MGQKRQNARNTRNTRFWRILLIWACQKRQTEQKCLRDTVFLARGASISGAAGKNDRKGDDGMTAKTKYRHDAEDRVIASVSIDEITCYVDEDGSPIREYTKEERDAAQKESDAAESYPLTWEEIIKLDPRVSDLYREICGVKDDKSKKSFCANTAWYGDGFKDDVGNLVGFSTKPKQPNRLLRTMKAYDIVYGKCYGALPNCRNCGCYG